MLRKYSFVELVLCLIARILGLAEAARADVSVLLAGQCDTGGSADGVAVSEDYAYVATGWPNGLQVIDISNPAAPVRVGGCNTAGEALTARGKSPLLTHSV